MLTNGRPPYFAQVLFVFQTPHSDVTERSSFELCHVFGSEPNL